MTLIATNVKDVEAEFQPLHKLFQALQINADPGMNVNNEMAYGEDNTTRMRELSPRPIKSMGELSPRPVKRTGELSSRPVKRTGELSSRTVKRMGELSPRPVKRMGEPSPIPCKM